jgi:hypothetical protein
MGKPELRIFEQATESNTVGGENLIASRKTTRKDLVTHLYIKLGGKQNGLVIKKGVIFQPLSEKFKTCDFSEKTIGRIISLYSKTESRPNIQTAFLNSIADQDPADQKKHWGAFSRVISEQRKRKTPKRKNLDF